MADTRVDELVKAYSQALEHMSRDEQERSIRKNYNDPKLPVDVKKAIEILAQKRSISLDVEPPKRGPSGLLLYDPAEHILLRDIAHKRLMNDDEVDNFLINLSNESDPYDPGQEIEIFDVEIPEWPPVPRSPLVLTMVVGGGSGSPGPFDDKPWTGIQPVVSNTIGNRNAAMGLAKKMVPFSEDFKPERVAYIWQCAKFDPEQHIVIRYWCERNNVDIVHFWRQFKPSVPELKIIKTTNPRVDEEVASGNYSPTRRCIWKHQEHLLQPLTDKPIDKTQAPKPAAPPPNPIMRENHDAEDMCEEVKESGTTLNTVQTYRNAHVAQALKKALGRDFRLFSRNFMDSSITAMTRAGLSQFLRSDPLDKRQYINDTGNRNFDCDDFALRLRGNLVTKHGFNCCGIVAGDAHAFNVFIIAGVDGPEVVFVEPQTDAIVNELVGPYSVQKRCEVLL